MLRRVCDHGNSAATPRENTTEILQEMHRETGSEYSERCIII